MMAKYGVSVRHCLRGVWVVRVSCSVRMVSECVRKMSEVCVDVL